MKLNELQLRDTCMAVSFLLLLIWFFSQNVAFIYGAMGLMLLGMIWPRAIWPLAWFWFSLANSLGHVMSTLLLSIVWAALVLPVGLARRCMGRDSLSLKQWHNGSGTCFITRDHTYTQMDLKNPY